MTRIVSILLCIWFVAMGVPKLFGMTLWAVQFENWGYPPWLMTVVGLVETACGALLLWKRSAIIAAALLIVVMVGAGYTHASHFQGAQVFKPTLTLAALLWLILKRRQQPNRRKAPAE